MNLKKLVGGCIIAACSFMAGITLGDMAHEPAKAKKESSRPMYNGTTQYDDLRFASFDDAAEVLCNMKMLSKPMGGHLLQTCVIWWECGPATLTISMAGAISMPLTFIG